MKKAKKIKLEAQTPTFEPVKEHLEPLNMTWETIAREVRAMEGRTEKEEKKFIEAFQKEYEKMCKKIIES